MSRVIDPSECGKFNVTDLEEQQNIVVNEFSRLPVFEKFMEMDEEALTQVLIENYHYSKSYRVLIDTAKREIKNSSISIAIERIAKYEVDPECHVKLHQDSLRALGIDREQLKSKPSSITQRFVDYVKDILQRLTNDDEENVFLSTLELRFATEVLPESQYLALVPAIQNKFNYEDEKKALEFYVLHAEMDGENEGLENVNASGHAAVFNGIVHELYNSLYTANNTEQNKALWQKCRKVYQQAFEQRKAFLEQF